MRLKLQTEYDRIQAADDFEVMLVGHDADDAAVRAAFLMATKVYHPNRFARRPRETRQLAHEVFLRIRKSYSALRREEDRVKVLAKLDSKGGSTRAKPAAAKAAAPTGPPAQTSESAAKPASPAPKRAGTGLSVTLRAGSTADRGGAPTTDGGGTDAANRTRFAKAVQLLNDGEPAQAREIFRQLAATDPHDKNYRLYVCYAEGRQQEEGGELGQARIAYQRALDLDDRFELASAALAKLAEEKPKSKGLFSRLFRR